MQHAKMMQMTEEIRSVAKTMLARLIGELTGAFTSGIFLLGYHFFLELTQTPLGRFYVSPIFDTLLDCSSLT